MQNEGSVAPVRLSVLDARYLKLDASNDPVTGDLLLKPTTNSTTTFQVQQSDTTVVLNVDTTNARVGIGTAAPDTTLHILEATGTELRIETSGSSDPALSFKTASDHIKLSLDESAGADILDCAGQTAGVDTTFRLVAVTGQRPEFRLYTGGTSGNFCAFQGQLNGSMEFKASTAGAYVLFDAAGDILFDADGGDFIFRDGGTDIFWLSNSASDMLVESKVQDKDIIFKGNDGGSSVEVARFDISEGQLLVTAHAATITPFAVKGAASQSANLQEWQDSGGNVLSGADERGILFSDGGIDASSVYIGSDSGKVGATGTQNTGIGGNTLKSVTSGGYNMAVGYDALAGLTEGNYNTAIGTRALIHLTTGSSNVALGRFALEALTTGSYNMAMGKGAFADVTGNYNVGIGYRCGYLAVGANYNIAIGSNALYSNVTGDNNIGIGYQAGYSALGASNVFIGYQAGYDETGANSLYIHNTSGLPLIGGDFTPGSMEVEIADQGDLAGESLSEGNFATHAKWDVTNDFDDTGGNAEYTFSANQTSTLTQTDGGDLAIDGVGDSWYKFVYTVAVTTAPDGDLAATITTSFAATAHPLKITAGTHTTYFKSAASPTDFVISIVSGTDTEGQFSYDNLSLKQMVGGDFRIGGTGHFGDGENYTQTSNVGVVSLVGSAKVYKEHTFTFNYARIAGIAKPTLVNVGAFFGFSLPIFNSDDEELFACICTPTDWDGTTDPVIYIGGWLDTANDTKRFRLQLSVETADFAGNDVVPATTNEYETETLTGDWAQYTSFKSAHTIDASAIGLAAGQPLAIRVRRIAKTGAEDEIAGEVVVEGAVIQYVADKLGGAT